MRFLALCLIVSVMVANAFAFNEPIDEAGSLQLRIEGPAKIDTAADPLACTLILKNLGDKSITGSLRVEVIDQWTAHLPTGSFTINPRAEEAFPFRVVPDKGTLNAWYPIHAYAEYKEDGEKIVVHPVLLVRTDVPPLPLAETAHLWEPLTLTENSRFSLAQLPRHRARVDVFGEAPRYLPVGWRGSDPLTLAHLIVEGKKAMPELHPALGVHPPWNQGRKGSLFIEFPLQLPQAQPITFTAFLALQPVNPGEPPSDGVLFRVYAAPFDDSEVETGTLLFERFTDTLTWEPITVDLSAYAGESMRLQLETHPGPNKDTTCDRALWGAPSLVVGTPKVSGPDPQCTPFVLGRITTDAAACEVELLPGSRGLLDSRVVFKRENTTLAFDGFSVTVLDTPLEEEGGIFTLESVEDDSRPGVYRQIHHFRGPDDSFDLIGEVRLEEGSHLRASFSLENESPPKPWRKVVIEDACLGSWSNGLHRIYAGLGNVIEEPEAFTMPFDGHQLATSFVGMDFINSFSLVQAVTAPPSKLEVLPQAHIYSMHSPIAPTFIVIPAEDVWQGVRIWRKINDVTAAPGVPRLAGRFVFDVWGGRYDHAAQAISNAARYGLTNSVLVWHNWQRWGYDYRLPEIYPPNPLLGSLEEFIALSALCEENDILFAPHDNYTDYYPDAPGFSYDKLLFNKNGQPLWAWLNEGRQAQAFRWRAGAYRPYLEETIVSLRDHVKPTAYFIDVWSSMGPFDAWTREGGFESRFQQRDDWAHSFEWIRETLGNNAPQISESGHDLLIGSLDGAQANHLRVDYPPETMSWTVWNIRCADSERIPWSDMAYHDRFILHGAGYDGRYRGGLSSALHGIYSDDYLSTEVMTGRPGMANTIFSRNVVRKYWLLNDLMGSLALKQMETLIFHEGDIHRQEVVWEEGGKVWVNRGKDEWEIEAALLPQYGFFAKTPQVQCTIERKGDTFVEWSKSAGGWYVNARRPIPAPLPISLTGAELKLREDRSFEIQLQWLAEGKASEDLRVFVHFLDDDGNILFQADHQSDMPTQAWNGTIQTIGQGTIPEAYQKGDSFRLFAGLWKPGVARRYLKNSYRDEAAVYLGQVTLDGEDDKVNALLLTPPEPEENPLMARMNPLRIPVDFGGVITNGACRIAPHQDSLVVTLLPEEPDFELILDLKQLPFAPAAPSVVHAEMIDGSIKEEHFKQEDEQLILQCSSDVFAYTIR
ncbi:MAG: hypothetical protein WCX86_00770 [Candidatus Hydrogenedentales bacterium]|jgi:hypothetical protein